MFNRFANPRTSRKTRGWQRQTGRWSLPYLVAIGIGVVLRVWQYAANPSIWVDEAAIARNVLVRQPWQLFGPLDFAQVAPPGFLLGVKLSVTFLGSSEYALRLVPFVAGLLSQVLFFVVARAVLRPVGTIVATILFSTAIPLIFFSSNLKQYSSDVAVTLVVVTTAFWLLSQLLTRRTLVGCVLASGLLLFCSQAAVFPLSIAGAVVFADTMMRKRPDRTYRLMLVLAWAAAGIGTVVYSVRMMAPLDSLFLHRFWAGAFMPRDGSLAWLWGTAQNVFAGPPLPALGAFDGSLHYPWPALFVGFLLVGAAVLLFQTPARGAVWLARLCWH